MRFALVTIIFCLVAQVGLAQDQLPKTALVTKVIDARTLELKSGEQVRLIGIEATTAGYEFAKRRLAGKTVRLEYDTEPQDRDGNLLAYVYVKTRYSYELGHYDDDYPKELLFNAEVIEKGYTRPSAGSVNVKYQGLFQRLYQQARKDKRGLWK